MNHMLDDFLVTLVLLISAGYALASLGPKSLRRRLLSALSRTTARVPTFLGLRGVSRRLAAASAAKASGACGGCDGCGDEPAGVQSSSAQKAPQRKSPSGEVKVPLAQIRRRTSQIRRRT